MSPMKRFPWLGVILLLASCATDAAEKVTVSAASSLQDAFIGIEAAFEEANRDIDVVLNFGASSSLREQILSGAPVDVFASADEKNMLLVSEAANLDPVVFATNSMVIAVPESNPAAIAGLEDLSRAEVYVGLCNSAVPCGSLAREVLGLAGVEPSVDSDEPNVRSLLTKIEASELDVGIVYVTDVLARTAVEGIAIPDRFNVTTDLPIAVLPEAPPSAGLFMDFVLSDEGRQILADQGFSVP